MKDSYTMDEHFDRLELSRVVSEIFGGLGTEKCPGREEFVIRMRFGIGTGGRDYTLEEVAQRLDITSERVRQIEAKALRKLRHKTRSKKLRTFLSPATVINDIEFIPSKTLQEMRGIEIMKFFNS